MENLAVTIVSDGYGMVWFVLGRNFWIFLTTTFASSYFNFDPSVKPVKAIEFAGNHLLHGFFYAHVSAEDVKCHSDRPVILDAFNDSLCDILPTDRVSQMHVSSTDLHDCGVTLVIVLGWIPVTFLFFDRHRNSGSYTDGSLADSK